jgi:membrane protease YdiL (CAAX protease family)
MGFELRKKILLWAEFLLLFIGIPLFMFFDTGFRLPSVVLIPSLVFIFLILRYRTEFRWRELVAFRISRAQLVHDGITILICGILLLAVVLIWIPDKLLNLPRGNPMIWLAMSLFYPVFSAYPQEIIFRTYIFRRYRRIFPANWMVITASGIMFSFAHILYYHPISMILTLVGGLYLANVYRRTGSVLYAAIIHGILGMLVYTVGLGEFFWLEMNEYL